MRRFLADALPHVILALFSAMILLPLLWVLRVSLTDKLTAYKIPPEMGALGLDELRRDLHRLHRSPAMVLQQPVIAADRLDRDRAAARDRDGLRLRPLQHRRPGAAARRAGQPDAAAGHPGAAAVRAVPDGRAASNPHRPSSSPIWPSTCRSSPGCWSPSSRARSQQLEEAARVDGATRFQAFCAGRRAGGGARPARRRPARLHPELERVPVRADPDRQATPDPAGRARRPRDACAASRSRRLPPPPWSALIPVLVLLPFLRRYLIKGLSLGALK